MKGQRRGFGSIRVEAQIGKTAWRTSVFPTKEGTYLLPVKESVRDKEGLTIGESVVQSANPGKPELRIPSKLNLRFDT